MEEIVEEMLPDDKVNALALQMMEWAERYNFEINSDFKRVLDEIHNNSGMIETIHKLKYRVANEYGLLNANQVNLGKHHRCDYCGKEISMCEHGITGTKVVNNKRFRYYYHPLCCKKLLPDMISENREAIEADSEDMLCDFDDSLF